MRKVSGKDVGYTRSILGAYSTVSPEFTPLACFYQGGVLAAAENRWLFSAAGAIILSIAYGYDVSEGETDHFIQLAEMGLEEFSVAANPGAFLVDVLPWRTSSYTLHQALLTPIALCDYEVRYIPASLPGMSFRRKAALWRQHLYQMANEPFQYTKSQMVRWKISERLSRE